jgi:hypothetical protein
MKHVLYAVALIVILPFALTACGDSDAVKVVKDYLKAGENQDLQKANSLLCESSSAETENAFAGFTEVELDDLDYRESDKSDDSVTVHVQGVMKVRLETDNTDIELPFQTEFELHKQNDQWCIGELSQ